MTRQGIRWNSGGAVLRCWWCDLVQAFFAIFIEHAYRWTVVSYHHRARERPSRSRSTNRSASTVRKRSPPGGTRSSGRLASGGWTVLDVFGFESEGVVP